MEPNTLNAALDDDDAVFGRFIELTRELGHVPTSNELRHARANDPSFASSGVFERLGSKDERVAGALERCRNAPVHSDVVAILEAQCRRRHKYDLRHTFATRLAASGQSMRTIQEFLGHADSKTTQIYAHYAPSAHEVEMVNAAFAEDEPTADDADAPRGNAHG